MTGHDDFDRRLVDWFEADAQAATPAAGLDRVLDATRRRKPRPAWLAGPGSHWVGDAGDSGSTAGVRSRLRPVASWTTALIVVLVVAALIAGAILVGAQLLRRPSIPTSRLGQLAYGLNGGIFVADWDGTHPVRIADLAPGAGAGCLGDWGEGSIWSPDGQRLAYRSASGDRCAGTVVITDPTTKAVASFPGEGWAISWSPDSMRVATWVDVFNTIGVYGVDGVRQALLTVPPGCAGAGDYDPRWSPDGMSLVGRGCEVPVDGRPAHTLPVTDPRSHNTWAFSPEGANVAYDAVGSLTIAAADGSQAQKLTLLGDWSVGLAPVWSPTGDRIAFTDTPYPIGPDGGRWDEIRVIDVASGAVTLLASAIGSGTVQLIGFSPEGDRILYSRTDASNASSLWTVRADGSDPQLLVAGSGWGDWQTVPAGP